MQFLFVIFNQVKDKFFWRKILNKCFLEQNSKIANKKLIIKLFVQHSSGDKRQNKGKKNSIDFVINPNEDDWMFEKSVTTRDQHKSFRL